MKAFVSLMDGRCTNSTITVVDEAGDVVASAPVPDRCPDHGWVVGPHRIAETLVAMGWQPVDYYAQRQVDGGIELDVVEVAS